MDIDPADPLTPKLPRFQKMQSVHVVGHCCRWQLSKVIQKLAPIAEVSTSDLAKYKWMGEDARL